MLWSLLPFVVSSSSGDRIKRKQKVVPQTYVEDKEGNIGTVKKTLTDSRSKNAPRKFDPLARPQPFPSFPLFPPLSSLPPAPSSAKVSLTANVGSFRRTHSHANIDSHAGDKQVDEKQGKWMVAMRLLLQRSNEELGSIGSTCDSCGETAFALGNE